VSSLRTQLQGMVVRAEELEKKYAQTSDQTVRLLQSKQVLPPCGGRRAPPAARRGRHAPTPPPHCMHHASQRSPPAHLLSSSET
jgi:hypothetical protein